jgi:phage terminase large subunit-like protein
MGRDLPRLETDWSDAAGTLADRVGAFARTHLGIDLMPWQVRFLSGLLAVDADGRFLHRVGLVSTARQQGKTTALKALIGTALTEWPVMRGGPITLVSTAHRLDTAVELFHGLADILEARFGAKPSRAYGRNEVKMPDGSRWLVKAAGPSAFHGISADVCIADEIWDISAEAIDQALVPTMRARRNPLFLMVSTAGTEASRVFQRYREQGLRSIDQGKRGALYFAEWSPPPDLDPMTVAAWEYANPSLGTTLDLETIQAEAQSPDRAAFLRASVNLWVASDRGWIAPGVWPALVIDQPLPPGGVVAVETSLDDSRYFGIRAVPLPDGRTGVTVEFHVDTLAECLEHVGRLGHDARHRFAITPTIDVHWPRNLEQRRTVVGYGELLKWTTAVKQMIDQGRLAHTGETMLAEHVQRAVAVRAQNAVALSSQRSPGPIELARCLVWAVALAARPASQGKPMIVVAGS